MLQYLLKFSISLAVLFIFYKAFLRPLTFYQWNRFYLLCYSLLSFVIPFVDVSSWVQKNSSQSLVNVIPAIGNYEIVTDGKPVHQISWLQTLTTAEWLLTIFCSGAVVMLVRLSVRFLALRNIRRGAVLLNDTDSVKLYETVAAISPFSFGNAIYFNRQLHTEDELKRIIQHEFVHVKQKHTIDLLLGELLCVVNWYNPFAWFIRYSIRQNLEFIADNNVVATGLDKKEYQYLLLKVVGIPQYSIANNFNFSNLKKRIAMMNKMKSAKLQLTKFLFVLPLLVVLLLAFRNKISNDNNTFVFTGIVYNNEEPLLVLAGVTVNEKYSGLSAVTDANGYFKLKIPVTNDSTLKIKYDFALNNVEKTGEYLKDINLAGPQSFSDLIFVGINRSVKDAQKNTIINGRHDMWSGNSCYDFQRDPGYDFVQDKFNEFRHQLQSANNIASKIDDSKKPFWFVDGVPYLLIADGIEGNNIFFDKYETKASSEYAVWLDGQLISIDEANAKVNRFELNAVGTCRAEYAMKEYGVNKNVFILYSKTTFNPLKNTRDTVPTLAPPVPDAPVLAAPNPAIPAPPPSPGVSINTAQPAIALNKKGYVVTIANDGGESIAIVKDKKQKIVKAMTLAEWNKNKNANQAQYGELPSQVPANTQHLEFYPSDPAVTSVADPLPENVKNITTASNTDKKKGIKTRTATVTLTDGKKEVYDLEKPDENAKFIKKYGKRGELRFQVAPPVPAAPDSIVKVKTTIPVDVLLIIDNKEMPAGTKAEDVVKPGEIEVMRVISGQEAIDQYGEKGRHNVIDIITKKHTLEKKDNTSYRADAAVRMHFDQFIAYGSITGTGNESIIDRAFSFETKTEKPLIAFDDHQFTEMVSCSPRPGKYKMVLLNANEAVAKYGDKGKNGAVEITTLSKKTTNTAFANRMEVVDIWNS